MKLARIGESCPSECRRLERRGRSDEWCCSRRPTPYTPRASSLHDRAEVEFDDSSPHRVDDVVVVGGHETVVPVRLIRSSSSMMSWLVSGSRLPVGSSASRTSGRFTKARAMATRCCSPPDSSVGSRSALPARPTRSSTSGTVRSITSRGLPITSSANATFSVTVFCCSSRKSWKTQPMLCRSFGTSRAGQLVDVEIRDLDVAGRSGTPFSAADA